ncbi:MAG TPA: (2Fe-2S)-binding protein [Actinopolymorphaceae bacterium]
MPLERRDVDPPMPQDAWPILHDVSSLGEFFTVARVTTAPSTPALADLYAGHPALADAMQVTGDALRTSEPRVAASILFQGLAARLWSPVIGAVAKHGVVLALPPATTWWSPALAGGRLHVADPELVLGPPHGSAERAADSITRVVIERHLRPLVAAMLSRIRLAEAVLWGDAASALVGTTAVVMRGWPRHTPTVQAIADALLRKPPLVDTWRRTTRGRPANPIDSFVRTSCCLYYRVPGGGLCGDCPLDRPPEPPRT